MADDDDKDDELLGKLDSLISTTHARKIQTPPPLLTDAIPDPADNDIPVLTDIVSPDAIEQETQIEQPVIKHPITDMPKLITQRVVAGIDREMAALFKGYPAHRAKLAVVHRSLRFALPELVRIRWEDTPSGESRKTPDQADTSPAE